MTLCGLWAVKWSGIELNIDYLTLFYYDRDDELKIGNGTKDIMA